MEVLACSAVVYGKKSCEFQENSVKEVMGDAESNSVTVEHAKNQSSLMDEKVDHLLPNAEVVTETMQCDVREMAQEPPMSGKSLNGSLSSVVEANGQKSRSLVDYVDNPEEQNQNEETCLNFHNSHVDVNTIDSETLFDNKEEDLSIAASKWPEHDEALALWVKWRGKWQAGIKCERADWPLATVKAKPTHDRKSYIVIFFPHTKNYSWADTLLVCAIDEYPQPIAHRSYKAGVQLVEDLTVARRFIMKKLVIGVLNIVDQLPIQVLAETARDVVVWREFATEASCCKGYPDLGRLLVKLLNMLLHQYFDANWLQHSFNLWVEKCQNAPSAESIEILKEELVDSILWSEINNIRDFEGQPALCSEWKTWKLEVMKCFSTTPSVASVGDAEQLVKITKEHLSATPLVTSPQASRKRAKLEVRRAETHNSVQENKSSQNNTVEIDPSFFSGPHDATADDIILHTKDELVRQGTELTSTSNAVDRCEEVVDTSNVDSLQNSHGQSQDVNGVSEAKSSASKTRGRQCIAFVESKGRKCVRYANEGDEYCCVHVMSRIAASSMKTEILSSAESPMCQGTTTLGHRCKHRSLPGLSFCKKHRLRSNAMKSPSSPGSQLKRKHDELLDNAEFTSCKDIVIVAEDQRLSQELPAVTEDNKVGENCSPEKEENFNEESNSKIIEVPRCIGLGLQDSGANCPDSPKRFSLYCDNHLPIWLKRARNGKSRIISKEVFLELLKTCLSHKQKVHLHQACDLFYKFFKSMLSVRNQVPKEVQFQCALSEASRELQVAELLMKLVCREKERLHRIWGFDLNKTQQVSSHVEEQSLMIAEDESYNDGSFKCTICSENFPDDPTLGAHWIDSHNKEAQWLFRGYACAICLDSFTNKKVLETHVQERHHAQFVEHCMLIQCIPCGSHFGNPEELWSHVLSVHTERFRQSKAGDSCHLAVSQHNPIPFKPVSNENITGSHSSARRFVCRFCGLKFDLLPDLGRHHQAAHMGPGSLNSRPKKKGLGFYNYRLKSGRLSHSRFKKGLGPTSYRLRNKGSLVLKKRLQTITSLGATSLNIQSHGMRTESLVRLTETQCSAIAKMLCSEAQKTKPRPNNHEIFSFARSACCKVGLQRSLEEKYGALPKRLYLKAAKLCSENNIQVSWHQEGYNCSRGCKPLEDENLGTILACPSNVREKLDQSSSNLPFGECEMDECHYVIDSTHFRLKQFRTTIILCDDISFGQENVPIPCVVDKPLIDSLLNPSIDFDGKVVFMPWESFKYVTKPLRETSFDVNFQNLQLGCDCSQPTCSPGTCDHVYLFNNDYEDAKDIDGKPMEGRFPYDDEGRLILEDDSLVYECNHLCKCSINCPNRVSQNGVRVKLEVFKTEKKGWAVRACERISRGAFICEFVGEVLDLQEVHRRRSRYGKDDFDYIYDTSAHVEPMSSFLEGQANYAIDATKFGNVSRFINHSCSPNLVSHLVLVESMDFAHIALYAKEDIDAGEELTFDYRYKLLPEDGYPCLCGATTCRGRLR